MKIYLLIFFNCVTFFLLNKIYLFIINYIGHLKLDILYIIFILTVSLIGFGLFFLAKFIFKKSAKDAIDSIIKNTGELVSNKRKHHKNYFFKR